MKTFSIFVLTQIYKQMKKIIVVFLLLTATQVSKAQELESILIAAEDASKLTEGYINPAMKGLMYSMNGGWFSTAKTHKKLGFDITINASASFVPTADQIFAFIPSDYSFLSLPNGETSLPTVMSENSAETMVDVSVPVGDGTFKVASFNMPGGITNDLPINAVPTPMVQVGVGLPFRTDIKVRYVPTVNFDNSVEANLIGLGLQHDLTQYLGPIDKLPLSVSILAAFTNMDVTYFIEDTNTTDGVSVTNGTAAFKLNTWTVQAIASLDFKIITFYGSLGYNNGSSSIKLKGDYNLTYDLQDGSGNIIGTVNELISNPINLNFDANGTRATIGARLNLAFFKIFADFTVQEYNTATAGIAFSFR
ncbi:FIG00930030: hypothetical protein [hydrothermal vent metagenome]|uniref:Uncharacterized protein n=1 Tax=hydrothermal vent metagenome TaxID=652676 RepID=A0A3B0QZD7_9ZZZZ